MSIVYPRASECSVENEMITNQQLPHSKQEEEEHKQPPKGTVLELGEHTKQQEEAKEETTPIFFRIWFGLKDRELLKTAIGSIAAAFSGISKPIFGFFIITIGIAYYEDGAKRKVGWYSLAFTLIGLLSLFTHIVQHYFFGVIGEKAMINLRRALYTGNLCR